MRPLARGGALALLTLSLGACNLAGDLTPPTGLATSQAAAPLATVNSGADVAAAPAARPDPQAGAAVYADKCEPCHGPKGLGDGPQAAGLPNAPAALGDPALARQASLADWYIVVTQGDIDRFMPPFASLSEQERWDVAAYALTLSAPQEGLKPAGDLYQEQCASCHGPAVAGGDGGPSLTDPATMAERSQAANYAAITSGVAAGMPGFQDSLSDDERWALAAFVQQLAFAPPGQAVAEAPSEAVPAEGAADTLSAKVINGTGGASVPDGLEVTLYGFDGQTEVLTQSAAADAQAEVAFTGLESVPGRLYILSAEYGGVRYASDAMHLGDPALDVPVPLTIYESTPETAALHVDQVHFLVDFTDQGSLQVIELWVLSNLGDRTIAPAPGDPGVEIPLPEGVENLAFQDGDLGGRFVTTERGFADLAPLRPGQGNGQLVFSFELPYRNRVGLRQPFDSPVSALTILVPEGGPRVSGAGIQDLGFETVTGVSLHQYASASLAPGDTLTLTFTGGLGGLGLGAAPLSLLVGAGAVVLAAGGVAWWYGFWRRKRRATAAPQAGAGKDSLLRAIAALDDAFEGGRLEEAEYRRRREELKLRVLAMMESEREGAA